ncbi:hypothetical protein LTR09_011881 [Extremus antarcticus]|uniref:F-box domain-containing protein n=1 Tax=Extremus antarcticus TaxID=702011 RepID=A0AAJ0D5V0_9PEZI|nr:hypothetical protein LTR09_011881 [Extremus antarcticus]
MAAASPPKGLFDLPRELRDEIWGYALGVSTIDITSAPQLAVQPLLCRVSRQLRYETLPLFYQNNIFKSGVTNSARENAELWLNAIGQDNIKTLRFLTLRGHRAIESELPDRVPDSCRMVNIEGIINLRDRKLEVKLCRCECGRKSGAATIPPTTVALCRAQEIVDRSVKKSDIPRRGTFGLVQLMTKFDRCCQSGDMRSVLQIV